MLLRSKLGTYRWGAYTITAEGTEVPDDIPEDQLKDLMASGQVEEVKEQPAKQDQSQPKK